MAVQYLVGAVGVIGILHSRRLTRRRMAEEGVVMRPLREVIAQRRGLTHAGAVKPQNVRIRD